MADVEVSGTTATAITVVVDAVVGTPFAPGQFTLTGVKLKVLHRGGTGLMEQMCYDKTNGDVTGCASPEKGGVRIQVQFTLHHSSTINCEIPPEFTVAPADDGVLILTITDSSCMLRMPQFNQVHIA